MLVQTVVAVNYLPLAVVLIRSLREHHSALRYSVLVTDASPGCISRVGDVVGEGIELLCCDDLEVGDIDQMREYYSLLEFNSAIKVLVLRHQLTKRHNDACLFLDPDMFSLASVTDVLAKCKQDILVTPHMSMPLPDDGELPNDIEVSMTGYVNGGVIYVKNSASARAALDWLAGHTKFNWFVAPRYGMYADQRWLSGLQYLFPDVTCVSRNPTINIAYWNLHERRMRELGGRYFIGDEAVRLFHFSGFSIPSNGCLSKHSNRRFDEQTEQAIAKLIATYEDCVVRESKRSVSLKGDLGFSRDSVSRRLARAEQIWGIRHRPFDEVVSYSGERSSWGWRWLRRCCRALQGG